MDPYTAHMVMLNQIGQLSGAFMEHVLSVLLGLVLIISGLLVAAIAEYLTVLLCRLFRWEKFGAWIGLSRMLAKVRPDVTLSVMTGQVLFWIVFAGFFMKALDKMNIGWFSEIGRLFFEYLPNGIYGGIILLVSVVVAKAVTGFVKLTVEQKNGYLFAGISNALIISLGTYGALITMGFNRQLILALTVVLMAGLVTAVMFVWVKQFDKGYFEVIRIPDVEDE